jgi:hypothetical protein
MTAALFAGPALMLGLAMPTAAFANDYTSPPPSVKPGVLATQYETQAAVDANTETLPFTGGDVTGMALIGAGAVLAGVVAVRRGRRRSVTPA